MAAPEEIIYINGKAYSAKKVSISMFGETIRKGVRAINYADEDSIEGQKSIGSDYDTDFVQGDTQCTGNIVMSMALVEKLQKLVPSKRIQNLPATVITISYIEPSLEKVKHTLRTVKFLKNERNITAGSTDAINVDSPLYIGKIDW